MSSDAPARPLYDRVVERLATLGKSKTWLAQRADISRGTIENWAKQPRPPQAATVNAVADALGIDRTEALRLAGCLPQEPATPLSEKSDLAEVPSGELVEQINRLVAELYRRIPE